MPKIICLSGMNKGEEYDLVDGENSMGRSDKNHICVFDKKSSRKHCGIYVEGDECFIEDLNSTNGVRVNNVFITGKLPLNLGDHIRIGQTVFLVSDRALKGSKEDAYESTSSTLIKRRKKYDNLLQKTSFQQTKTTSLRKIKSEKEGKETGFLTFLERQEQ